MNTLKTAKQHNAVLTGESELLPMISGPREIAKPVDAAFNFESAFRYAVDKGGGSEVMNTLMNIRRELNAEASKKAFDQALSAFQAECPIVLKEKAVPTETGKTAYKYAPIEAIEIQIRPLLRKHGFSHTFDTDTTSAQGWVIAKCIVTHPEGHSRTSTAKLPLGTKTKIMSDTQVYASALTFANRRALCNAYGLVLAGEDMDGQTGKLKGSTTGKVATAETLRWFLDQTADIREKQFAFAIDHGLIEPNDTLDKWPLARVPTSKAELAAIRKEIEAHV